MEKLCSNSAVSVCEYETEPRDERERGRACLIPSVMDVSISPGVSTSLALHLQPHWHKLQLIMATKGRRNEELLRMQWWGTMFISKRKEIFHRRFGTDRISYEVHILSHTLLSLTLPASPLSSASAATSGSVTYSPPLLFKPALCLLWVQKKLKHHIKFLSYEQGVFSLSINVSSLIPSPLCWWTNEVNVPLTQWW